MERVIFRLRPPQTYMPYGLPRPRPQHDRWNDQLQQAYGATQRVAPYDPNAAPAPRTDTVGRLKELAELRSDGVLTDDEFEQANAKVLAEEPA
jgi:hypothetical protein